MTKNRKEKRKPSLLYVLLATLAGLALMVCLLLVVYQPDRPVATIPPGSSSKPAFVVQVIRPRLGLPFGGILPPNLFGHEAHLGFDSSSNGATVHSVRPGQIELSADGWDLHLVFDKDGRVTTETQIVFDLMFEDRLRTVRCRPGTPVVGTLYTATPGETAELSGNFDIELARCEDAKTGDPLGWPPEPLILHGSFDRLPQDSGDK